MNVNIMAQKFVWDNMADLKIINETDVSIYARYFF